MVTAPNIASCLSAHLGRRLLLQNVLKINSSKELVVRRENQVRTQFTKKWDDTNLKAAGNAMESVSGSTSWCSRGLSAYKSNGSFELDKNVGTKGVCRPVLRPTEIVLQGTAGEEKPSILQALLLSK